MGKVEKILEIVSLIFGIFYYICDATCKKKSKKDALPCDKNCEAQVDEGCQGYQGECETNFSREKMGETGGAT